MQRNLPPIPLFWGLWNIILFLSLCVSIFFFLYKNIAYPAPDAPGVGTLVWVVHLVEPELGGFEDTSDRKARLILIKNNFLGPNSK